MFIHKIIFATLFSLLFKMGYSDPRCHIVVNVSGKEPMDSLFTLTIYDKAFLPNLMTIAPARKITEKVVRGNCHFNIELADPAFLFSVVSRNGKIIVDKMVAEIGDSIVIHADTQSVYFSGKDFEKYKLISELKTYVKRKSDSLNTIKSAEINLLMSQGENGFLKIQQLTFDKCQTMKRIFINEIAKLNYKIPRQVFQILTAEITGTINLDAISTIFFFYLNGNIHGNEVNYEKSLELLDPFLKESSSDMCDEFNYSPAYSEYLFNLISLESYLYKRKIDFFQIVDQRFNGLIQEKLKTDMLLLFYQTESNLDSLLAEVISSIKYVPYKNLLKGLSNVFTVGAKLYNFSLPDKKGELISLSDFKGKLVFVHFWFKGCFPCAQYYQRAISYAEDKYKGNPDVIFVAISLDKDRKTWLESIKGHNYTSMNAVNLYTCGQGFDHDVCKHLYIESAPTCFLVDTEGRLITTNEYDLGGGVHPDPDKLVTLIENNLKGMRQ